MGTTRMFSGAGSDGHGEVPGLYSGRDERSLKLYLWWMRVLCNCCLWWQMRAVLMPIYLPSASCLPGTVLSASLDATSQVLMSP